jgi:hypothetical protein
VALLTLYRRLAGMALILVLGTMMGSDSGTPLIDEYQMKAIFLCNFAAFVEWPDRLFERPTQPISICVMGQDPFGHWLEDAVKGRMIGDRRLTTHRISRIGDARSCRVIFIATSAESRLPSLMSEIRSTGVLTVGESDVTRQAGVVITFAMEGRKVRFGINTKAAECESLRISAKLLGLSHSVRK